MLFKCQCLLSKIHKNENRKADINFIWFNYLVSNSLSPYNFAAPPKESIVPTNPCQPSPCGHNAKCRIEYSSAVCECERDYHGNPYEGCRPECLVSSDCPMHRACIRSKCEDPCPGTCGVQAICTVSNHVPICSCPEGYTGDAFRICQLVPVRRKPSCPFPSDFYSRGRQESYFFHLQKNQCSVIRAARHLADQTLFVEFLMAMPCANVLQATLVILVPVDVAQNVSSVQTVQEIKLASIQNVSILALVFAVMMPCVKLLITVQCAVVHLHW